MTTVTRYDFGFPVNVTEEILFEEIDKIKARDYTNKGVHLKITLTHELKKSFNVEEFKQEIKDKTHAYSVKVDFIYNDNTTERSSEIAKAQSVQEKFIKFCELHEIKYEPATLKLLEDIQNEMFINNFVPNDSFELEYISLRGNIGIWEGQHKEEVNVDFTQFSDGIVLLTGDNGCGKCISGDSIILSDNGFNRIGNYWKPRTDGFRPMQVNLYTEKDNKSASSHFYTEKVPKTIKITNSLGMTLEGTPDHPVLIFDKDCEYKFKKLKDITTNDYVCVSRGMNIFPENKPLNYIKLEKKHHHLKNIKLPDIMTPELAKFFGYYMANGNRDTRGICFSSTNKKLQEEWKKCVKDLFGCECKTFNGKDFKVSSVILKDFIKAASKYPVKTAKTKVVPQCVLESDKECQKAFLTAYFDCDTSLYNNVFEICSASKNMIDMIQNMLLNFGIFSLKREKRVKGYSNTYYRLSIRGEQLNLLMSEVMDKSIKYNYKQTGKTNTNLDSIPYIKEYSKSVIGKTYGGHFYEGGISYLSPLRYNGSKNLSYDFIDKFLTRLADCGAQKTDELYRKILSIKNKNYFYSKITKTEVINIPNTVYDFTIPSTHTFYSNGYISHNTTFLEMMNPYNSHLTRNGTLKDFFILKDSHKILIYRSSTGKRYKISMFVDGHAKNVMTSYKVQIKEAGSDIWVDGPEMQSADAYKKWVESVFGPKDLFMRTAFFTTKQVKNIPDLSVASKSEKMNLFSTLAGTDYLSVISEQAKNKITDEEKVIEEIKGQLKDFDNIETRLSDISKTIEDENEQLKNYDDLIKQDTKELEGFNEKQKTYLSAAGAFDFIRSTLEEKKSAYGDTERELDSVNNNIEALNEELEDIDLYKEQLVWYNDNMKKRGQLEIEKSKLDDERLQKTAELDTIDNQNREIQKIIDDYDKKIYKINIDIESLTKSIPDLNGTCPVCGAPLSEHKKEELKAEKENIEEAINVNTVNKEFFIGEKKEQMSKIVDTTELRAYIKSLTEKLKNVSNDIIQINEYASKLEIEKIKDLINNSTKKLDDYNKEAERLTSSLNKLDDEIASLTEKMNTIPTDYSDKIARLNRGILDSQQQIATLKADISNLEREQKMLNSHESLIKEIKSQIKAHKELVHNYTIIMNAFGNNGIQTNELDSAAPEISDITNAILHDTYGDRFTVKFETERESKNGKKLINDFVIKVFDSRSGSWKTLEDLSQGEGLWVKQALYYAFSVIRTRRTGFCFKTRFLDESDGPLDSPETKLTYLRMIEKAHELSNASKTILITHSAEIKNMVHQGIYF